jgi:cobalt-zinc-cadmium efflux system outer membrane protein
LRERVTLDFVAAWVAQERFWMLREARLIANSAVVAAQERIKAGAASPVEKTRAQNSLAIVSADLVRADAALAASRRSLALRWGSSEVAFDSLSLPSPESGFLERDTASEGMLSNHPAIAGAEAETAGAAARLRVAEAQRIPDVDLRFGVRRIDGLDATAFVAGVTLPLPIWNSRKGEVAAAQADHARTQSRRIAVEQRLRTELESAHAELRAATQAYAGLVRDAVPAAEEALATLQGGYRDGRYSYVELAEGQRAALQTGIAVVESMAGVWRAIARLERLAGPKQQTGGMQ